MKPIFITQRVATIPEYGERRDCLDQNWFRFLASCGAAPIAVPNDVAVLDQLIETVTPGGVVLTGGNDLESVGGDAPERDETERHLLSLARQNSWPVIGVCRGMQVIQDAFGISMERVEGHVQKTQTVPSEFGPQEVNSFHNFGTMQTVDCLSVWAKTEDGVIKAVHHTSEPIVAMMWHPERMTPFRPFDQNLFREHFGL